MPRNDPKFVRLAARLVTGCLGDTEGSGFFIGGRDVQPFPDEENPMAQVFVREHLRRGTLEEAREAEHKIVREAGDQMKKMHLGMLDEHEAHDRAGLQEAQIQTFASRTVNRLDRLRNAGEPTDEELLEDEGIAESQPNREVGGRRSATVQQTAGKMRQQARAPEEE